MQLRTESTVGEVHANSRVYPGERDEDRAAIFPADGGLLLVIADGAGGTVGGAAAAEAVVDAVRGQRPGADWVDLLRDLDQTIAADPQAGESMAVIVELVDGILRGASVGDSTAWLVSASAVEDLTSSQHRRPRLGSGEAHPVAFGPNPMVGRLLLGTDGLFNYVSRVVIANACRDLDLDHIAKAVVTAARLPSGRLPDDIGLILCDDGG